MIIRNGNESLSFAVEGYEFPNQKTTDNGYDYDANWLEVKITFSDGTKHENYRDACLLTYELEELINGISAVAKGNETLFISDFMEPYLKFVVTKAGEKIVFGMEFVYDTTGGVWRKHGLSEEIRPLEVQNIVEELKSILLRYPQR